MFTLANDMFILVTTKAPIAQTSEFCSGGMTTIIAIIGLVLRLIQWVVPVILILLGTIDLVKAVTKGKEDEIKKEQKTLITRVIAAVIVFLVPLIVSTLTGLLGTDDWKQCWNDNYKNSVSDITSIN